MARFFAVAITISGLLLISLGAQSGDHPIVTSDDEITENDQALLFLEQAEINDTATENGTLIPNEKFSIFETYFPLFFMFLEMPQKEREVLQNYLFEKTYEKLKFDIDSHAKNHPEGAMNISLASMISSENDFDQETNELVQGYHNASIYNAIRSVWLKQLRPFLPLIDQMAIMQYFSQRKAIENERMSFWARIWENISLWMSGKDGKIIECHAQEPNCVRSAMESLTFEQRIYLDQAAYENRFDSVDEIIRNKLDEQHGSSDLDSWLHQNRPPKALESLLDERTEVEEEALQRLRDNGVLSSLKHYYKAVIETRSPSEQEEIRKFFDTMNNTFAKCFDPLRDQFHDF